MKDTIIKKNRRKDTSPWYDPETKLMYDPRTKKAYPVEQVPSGLRLGKPYKIV